MLTVDLKGAVRTISSLSEGGLRIASLCMLQTRYKENTLRFRLLSSIGLHLVRSFVRTHATFSRVHRLQCYASFLHSWPYHESCSSHILPVELERRHRILQRPA